MNKKILIGLLAVLVVFGGVYAFWTVDGEGGTGFIGLNPSVEKTINPKTISLVSDLKLNDKQLNNIELINKDIKIVDNKFELLDAGQVFDKLVGKPISFVFDDSSLYRVVGNYTNDISYFSMSVCSASVCALDYEEPTADNPLPAFERLTLNQVTSMNHYSEFYRLTLKKITGYMGGVIEISNIVNSDYTNYAIPLHLVLETSDDFAVEFASDDFAVDSSIELRDCQLSANNSCTFVYSDFGHTLESIDLGIGKSVILQTKSKNAYKITLLSFEVIGPGEYTAEIEVEKRG